MSLVVEPSSAEEIVTKRVQCNMPASIELHRVVIRSPRVNDQEGHNRRKIRDCEREHSRPGDSLPRRTLAGSVGDQQCRLSLRLSFHGSDVKLTMWEILGKIVHPGQCGCVASLQTEL